jgi:hypothetical protein
VTSSNSAYHSTAVQQRPLRWLLSIQPSAYEQESRHERRGAKQQCLKWGVGTRATNCQQETKLGGIGDYSSYKTTNLFVFVVGRSVFHFRCPPVAGWKENYQLSVRVGSSAGSVAKGRPSAVSRSRATSCQQRVRVAINCHHEEGHQLLVVCKNGHKLSAWGGPSAVSRVEGCPSAVSRVKGCPSAVSRAGGGPSAVSCLTDSHQMSAWWKYGHQLSAGGGPSAVSRVEG